MGISPHLDQPLKLICEGGKIMRSHRIVSTAIAFALIASVTAATSYFRSPPSRLETDSLDHSSRQASFDNTVLRKVANEACIYRTELNEVILTLDPNCPVDAETSDPGTLLVTIQTEGDAIVITGTDL